MAELGIALFGFSGVVSVFGRNTTLPWTIQDKVWFGGLLNWSFILIVGGFTPSIMREVFPEDAQIWYASNLILLVVHVVSYCWFGYNFFLRLGPGSFRSLERWLVIPSYVVATTLILLQVSQVIAPSPYIHAVYMLATAWFIYCSACAFVFMLFPRSSEVRS